jgi:hypothetical protein
MKASHAASGSQAVEAGHVTDTAHHRQGGAAHHEPTIVEIVDRVTTMHPGDSCDVELDPHITRINNLERLLPICVGQFGRSIDMCEHPEGDKVILTITVIDEQRRQ